MRSLRAVALAVTVLLPLACSGNGSDTPLSSSPGSGAVTFETIRQQSIPGQGGDTLREVARDQESWNALWNRLRENGGEGFLPPEPPAVDFSRDMVIVAAMGLQSCISKVTIRGIDQGRGELVVDLLETSPGPNCVCIVAERPIHVVRLPRSADPVRFEVEQGQTICG